MNILRSFMSGNIDQNMMITFMARIFTILLCSSVHEYSHAWMAYRLGDDTAKLQGRLTLNPLKHISWIGTLMIFLFGFGFAKPVPVNPSRFRDRKKGFALTAAAGPASNFIMAIFFMLLSYIFLIFASSSRLMEISAQFFFTVAFVNVALMVFNLFPIPPLDGSRIFGLLLPDKYYYTLLKYEQYIWLGLMLGLYLGILDKPLNFAIQSVFNGLDALISLPFRFIIG